MGDPSDDWVLGPAQSTCAAACMGSEQHHSFMQRLHRLQQQASQGNDSEAMTGKMQVGCHPMLHDRPGAPHSYDLTAPDAVLPSAHQTNVPYSIAEQPPFLLPVASEGLTTTAGPHDVTTVTAVMAAPVQARFVSSFAADDHLRHTSTRTGTSGLCGLGSPEAGHPQRQAAHMATSPDVFSHPAAQN